MEKETAKKIIPITDGDVIDTKTERVAPEGQVKKTQASTEAEKATLEGQTKKTQSDTEAKEVAPASKSGRKRKPVAGFVVLIIGIVALATGLILMITQLSRGAELYDAEYLVEVGTWARADAPEVIWEFTEIGKGQLTTNDGLNKYDFLWAIEGDTLKIETDWLYTLNDEYEYQLDRGDETLILDGDIEFRAAGSVDAEITEDH